MAFKIYKPGQGRYARISAGVLLGLLIAYGCASLRGALSEAGTLVTFSRFTLTYAQVVPVAIFILAVAAIAVGLNYPKFADFLIETEIEMGRVVWPTRQAVVASSVVVIVTVVGMAMMLWAVDKGLVALLELVKLY
ncbi:MAG: preprotein translocase subunit SecE [Planctomycetes bacterium]|nr:preprotein translocase subunit SecE [Planctomycetota bacterium]